MGCVPPCGLRSKQLARGPGRWIRGPFQCGHARSYRHHFLDELSLASNRRLFPYFKIALIFRVHDCALIPALYELQLTGALPRRLTH